MQSYVSLRLVGQEKKSGLFASFSRRNGRNPGARSGAKNAELFLFLITPGAPGIVFLYYLYFFYQTELFIFNTAFASDLGDAGAVLGETFFAVSLFYFGSGAKAQLSNLFKNFLGRSHRFLVFRLVMPVANFLKKKCFFCACCAWICGFLLYINAFCCYGQRIVPPGMCLLFAWNRY